MFINTELTGARRDLLKTGSFAALHFAVGFSVSYAFTGSIVIASGIALVEPLINTLVFYVHERAWNRSVIRDDTRIAVPARRSPQAS